MRSPARTYGCTKRRFGTGLDEDIIIDVGIPNSGTYNSLTQNVIVTWLDGLKLIP